MAGTLCKVRRFAIYAVCIAALCVRGEKPEEQINPEWSARYPVFTCTGEELLRLREARAGSGAGRAPVEAVVQEAEEALKKPLVFPPRGGQHRQWYQCDACQVPLETIDDTHHQCPKCGRIYSGEPYDGVVFRRIHVDNLERLYAAAWAYAITDDLKFAEFARKVLLGYSERYLTYPYHSANRKQTEKDRIAGGRLFSQTLTEAAFLTKQIAPAYDLIHDAPVMTADDHRKIREGLLVPMLESIDQYKAGGKNWQTWHNAAMLTAGAVLKDESWVVKAISDPDNGFRMQMDASITDDGMWYENSLAYHFYALKALVKTAEAARHLNIDLWSSPRLKSMFTLPIKYVMPDGSLPRFGDDVNTRVDAISDALEFAYHAYDDESMLPYLSKEPTWDSVMLGRDTAIVPKPAAPGSDVFRSAGHAILRAGGEKGLTTALTFGPYGGFHGHFDKLSFAFFGFKTELGVDPGRAASQAYRLPIHKNWYRATLSHNAVLVDRSSQEGAAGELELFAANEKCAAVLVRCDAAYPGTADQRLLVLTPGYLLVVDRLDSNTERQFDWLYHNRGSAAVCDAATEPVDLSGAFAGSEYIDDAERGGTDGTVRVQFKDGSVTTCLTMAAAPGTEILTGTGPGASVDDRVPLVMISRHGEQARFAAVLEPVSGNQLPTVQNVCMTEEQGAIRIDVQRGTAKDIILLNENGLRIMQNDEVALENP